MNTYAAHTGLCVCALFVETKYSKEKQNKKRKKNKIDIAAKHCIYNALVRFAPLMSHLSSPLDQMPDRWDNIHAQFG